MSASTKRASARHDFPGRGEDFTTPSGGGGTPMTLYTPQQAADRLGISKSLVFKLLRSGDLRCHRITKNTPRISEEHIEEFLRNCERGRLVRPPSTRTVR